MAIALDNTEALPRNSPCPCGSGRRYKDCHGVADRQVEPKQPIRLSRYRPTGPDWDHLPEPMRDASGRKMESALQLQTAGREADAELLYRSVLNIAPNTHDALHMLGVINFRRGDLVEAEGLIKAAMALRQGYANINKNWNLVQDAINARQQRDIQIVCEGALPLLANEVLLRRKEETDEPSTHGKAPPEMMRSEVSETHVISDFADATGEGAWFARRVAALLDARAPKLWSIQSPVDCAPGSGRMHTISAIDRQVPVGGVQILVGIDCDLDGWIEQSAPDRLLVFGLAAPPGRYLEQLRYLATRGAPRVELVFRSRAEAGRFGCRGPILLPPLEPAPPHAAPTRSGTPFTLGTIGCEERTVHAGDDQELLEALAKGARLSILAPGRLRYALGGNPAIEFHSRHELALDSFLLRIDALLHRVPNRWEEGCGLALFGAMARGLPVLCSRDSLYAEYIEHERNGLLYSDESEIVAMVQRLGSDVGWARAIGAAARAQAAELFDRETLLADYNELVRPAPVARYQ
jgi:hypothetical protein